MRLDTIPLSSADTGIFIVYATQIVNGCESDKTPVTFRITAPPYIDLPEDTLFCPEYEAIIGTEPMEYYAYLWNTMETASFIQPPASGTYVLEVNHPCGNVSDSIKVLFDPCEDCAWIPNSFSPNSDGINDKFGIEIKCPVQEYQLWIFNRWGQKIFESYQPGNDWHGDKEDLGTYFYYLKYRNINNDKLIFKKGDVTLIR